MALNILKAHQQQQAQQQPGANSGSSSGGWSPEQVHASIEACRMSFADALAWVADPVVHDSLPLAEMLSQQRAAARYSQYFDAAKVRAGLLWAVCERVCLINTSQSGS
jgi:gamma-glutamyltranspeptidase